jgi:uncharacterized coiled-coil protein SlyX
MASFDENGKYIKTNWKAGDKITATKLNKIEESIEAVNDNDISRHVEADARLDALEAKDAEHDKELTNVKNTIADNKAATDIYVYDINSRMQFLEAEMNDGIAYVDDMATSINNTITNAETTLNTIVTNAETNLNAIVTDAETNLNAAITDAETNLNDAVHEAEENLNEAIRIAEENLNNGGGNIGPRLDALEASTSSLQTSVSSLQDELATTVSSLQTELATNISSLQTSVSSLQSAVSALQSEVATNVATIESNINGIRGVL